MSKLELQLVVAEIQSSYDLKDIIERDIVRFVFISGVFPGFCPRKSLAFWCFNNQRTIKFYPNDSGGRQEVNLQNPGCVTKKGTVLHELLHAIGFMHEQSRPERDNFVEIVYKNIKPGETSFLFSSPGIFSEF